MEGFGDEFPFGGKLTSWKVGKGDKLRIGSYTSVGNGDLSILLDSLIISFQNQVICTLELVAKNLTTFLW